MATTVVFQDSPKGPRAEVIKAMVDERVASETAKSGAEAAHAAAQTERVGAETARSGAETARSGAEAAQAAAQTARTGAETARSGAETARSGAETAQAAAQTARTGAETAQAAAEAAAENAQAAALTLETWAALSALTGSYAGQGAEVLDADTGTHTDPVVGGSVANAGCYSWSASPAGWRWIGGTGLSGKASIAALAAETSRAQAAEGALADNVAVLNAATEGMSGADPSVEGDEVWGLADMLRRVAVALHRDGRFRVARLLAEAAEIGSLTIADLAAETVEMGHAILGDTSLSDIETDWDFAIADPAKNVIFGVRGGQVYFAGQGASGAVDVTALDRRNKDFADRVRARRRHVQLPTATYNLAIGYGQSLMEGNETWPSLSKSPVIGALMLGLNVDQSALSGTYTPIGPTALNPLVAHTRVGTANLTDAQEAALVAGDQAIGEPPVIAAVNGMRRWMLRRAMVEDDGRKVVALHPAIGGRTIEALSKGDAANIYPLIASGVDLVKALTTGQTLVACLVTFAQGEYNYFNDYNPTATTDRAPYAALMHTLFDDMRADLMAQTGQALPPLILTYQTGATYSRDVSATGASGLNIGMAQLDVALARDDAAMIGPVYPVTDKGAHLDSNGSRWFGWYYAKVARKILFEDQGWEPLRPLQVQVDGSDLYVSYHVPAPPLAFRSPYVASVASTWADRGFRVTSADRSAARTITAVEIVAPTVIKISLGSAPQDGDILWYADKTIHNGNGMVADSDPEVAWDDYEYVPERGMYAAANIATLVGKPYPLHNWSVAFSIPLTYSEF